MPVSRKYNRVHRAMAGKRFPGEAETILKKTDCQYDAFRRSTPDTTFPFMRGDRFTYRHSMKAPDEMHRLHEQFYRWLEKKAI